MARNVLIVDDFVPLRRVVLRDCDRIGDQLAHVAPAVRDGTAMRPHGAVAFDVIVADLPTDGPVNVAHPGGSCRRPR